MTRFRLFADGPASNILQELQIPVIDTSECQRVFQNFPAVIDNRVMCAGYAEGGKDACQVSYWILIDDVVLCQFWGIGGKHRTIKSFV